jgi:large conductance mechanosensitive channel
MGGFRKFLLRGNLVDLAVAVVIGVAFNNLVQALVKDLITPLITAFGKAPNFEKLSVSVHNSTFAYGQFLNTVVSFLMIATVVYFFLVAPVNRLTTLSMRKQEATERPCPECLSDIPVAATRCKFCTATVEPAVNGQSGHGSPAGVARHRATWRPRS